MTLKEFLQKVKKGEYTFTIAKAVKDEHTPFHHSEYYQTPIRYIDEWNDWAKAKDYIVINPDSCPIDVTGVWQNHYKRGFLYCAIITTEEDLRTKYGEKQGNDMIEYYDKLVKKWLLKKGLDEYLKENYIPNK